MMQGTAGEPGKLGATDPVERALSRVAAVACFYPPTDFLNYGHDGEDALGRGVLAAYKSPFDVHEFDRTRNVFVPVVDEASRKKMGREISPVYHVSSDDPPTLMIHGDADKLVLIQQAQLIEAKLRVKLIVKPGAGHGWPDLANDLTRFADWFDEHLKPVPPRSEKN